MEDDYLNMYDIVGGQQKYAQESNTEYTKPVVSHSYLPNVYQSSATSRDDTHGTNVKKGNKKSCFIVIGVLLTLAFLLAATALAFVHGHRINSRQ